MNKSDWKKLGKYSIQHTNGNRVNIISGRYEVWYLVNGKYKQGGICGDRYAAMREAAKGLMDGQQ